MSIVRRALTWLLCLALVGQQGAASAAVPCDHVMPAPDASAMSGHEGHAGHGAAEAPVDPHAAHGMHGAMAVDAAGPSSSAADCDCGCAMTACLQSASSVLPAELTFARSTPRSVPLLAEARTFALDRERATLFRPPIAA